MECPFCKSCNSKVLESRTADEARSIRRRRECLDCAERFTTYERVELAPLVVMKKSGSKEVYAREKLTKSIIRSCSKTQLSVITVDNIIDKVESKLYKTYGREINSNDLGEIVMEELKKIDLMAYIRYASIFKQINSVEEFIDEIKNAEDMWSELNFEVPLRK